MTFGRPQTIGDQLFAQVEAMLASGVTPSPFELRRLKVEADRLQRADSAVASIVKSAIAAFEWNFDEVRRWAKNAIALRNTPAILVNCGINFRVANLLPECLNCIDRGLQMAPSDPTIVLPAINALKLAGRWSDIPGYLRNLQSSGEDALRTLHDAERIIKSLEIINISEIELQQQVLIAFEIAKQHQVRIHRAQFETHTDPEIGQQLVVGLVFAGDVHTELKLESLLAHALMDRPGWNPMLLSVEFEHENGV